MPSDCQDLGGYLGSTLQYVALLQSRNTLAFLRQGSPLQLGVVCCNASTCWGSQHISIVTHAAVIQWFLQDAEAVSQTCSGVYLCVGQPVPPLAVLSDPGCGLLLPHVLPVM